jgi:protein ImuB
LFLPPSPEPEKLELTLARIAGMVGENKVGALELLDTHHPEGFRMRRFMADHQLHKKMSKKKIQPRRKRTPGRDRSAPLPSSAARHRDAGKRPAVHIWSVRKKKSRADVLWRAGPWRFSGDWWEREAWSRDEWDIAYKTTLYAKRQNSIVSTAWCTTCSEGGWFVEGTYD